MSEKIVTVKQWLGDLYSVEEAARMYVRAHDEGWSKFRRDYWYAELRQAVVTVQEDGAWTGWTGFSDQAGAGDA
jgi:hypothetical protein